MSILDAKYEKANIDATITTLKHLSCSHQQQLKALLYKFEHLFDGSLGDWNTDPVSFKLKEGSKPFQLPPFSVPKVHQDTLKRNTLPLRLRSFKTPSSLRISISIVHHYKKEWNS